MRVQGGMTSRAAAPRQEHMGAGEWEERCVGEKVGAEPGHRQPWGEWWLCHCTVPWRDGRAAGDTSPRERGTRALRLQGQ